jgi:phosphoribosylanthranilate isomerase
MVRVKICGVTTPADTAFAADCGADAVGLNFFPRSPRFLTTSQAEAVIRELPAFTAAVGVFVDTPEDDIRAHARQLGLRAVQSYATDPPTGTYFPAAHIPAFRMKDAADLDVVRRFVAACRPAAVLIDSFVPGEMGGTGHHAPWHLLAGFNPGVPVILAGGLTPENVADAISVVRPWGVDVASGVESAPGRKDPGRVRAFVQAARSVTL